MRTFFLILLVVLASACTKAATSPDAGQKPDAGSLIACAVGTAVPVSASTFCDAFLGAVCDAAIRCKEVGVDRATCIAAYGQNIPECASGLLGAGAIDVDPASGGCCLAALQASDCSGPSILAVDHSCTAPFFTPKLPLGAPCTTDESCLPSDAGVVGCFRGEPWSSCSGICSNGRPLGSPCDDFYPGANCLGGWCRIDAGTSGTCETFVSPGAACVTSNTCDPGSFCDSTQGSPTCTSRHGEGQPCSGDVCEPGLHCGDGACHGSSGDGGACDSSDPETCAYPLGCYGGICRPGQLLLGDPCSGDAGDCTDATCTAVPDGGAVCLPEPGLGEACATSCVAPYQCSAGICTAQADVGEACSALSCRSGLSCASGTCAALPGPGESCGPNHSCLVGYCEPTSQICQPFTAAFGPCKDDSVCGGTIDAMLCQDIPADGGDGYCNTCEPVR